MPTGNLPSEGKKLFEEVYQKAKTSSTCKDAGDRKEECAARVAWTAVHNAGWKKDAKGEWHKSEVFAEFSMRIEKAIYDKTSNEYRIRTVASDTDEDKRKDNMSLEIFNDFIDRIEKNELVPEEYRSDFWKGGEPYISVSHYPDFNGKAVPGIMDATYVDGSYLKSKGKFLNTPLGRKCFEAVCSDLYGETKNREDKIRISIAFLDYMHKHKSNGYVFDRQKNPDTFCPECLLEMIKGESQGKIYLKGHLIHEALTRVPVNTRTSMEVDKSMADKVLTRKDDAKSIVGDELTDELEEQAELVGKSDALTYRSENEEVEEALREVPTDIKDECVDPVTGEKIPECEEKKTGESPSGGKPPQGQQKQSELVEEAIKPVEVSLEEIKSFIRETVESIIKKPISGEPILSHPLDTIFADFKSKFDEVIKSDASETEKLQQIQIPFNDFGSEIVTVVKSSIKSKEITPEVKIQSDLVNALSQVMNPIAQKLDLVITQLSTPQVEKPMLSVPQRRSISPSVVQQIPQAQVSKSETPNLRKVIERTT